MAEVPFRTLLTREQKTGFVLLLVFACLVVSLGFLQLRNAIYSPFVIRLDKKDLAAANLIDPDTKLQMEDTDHDGLSDYDELRNYGTSPYLPDTDSDTVKDKDEIDRGTDPNCPEGKVCSNEDQFKDTSSTQQVLPLPLQNASDASFNFVQSIGTALEKSGGVGEVQSEQISQMQSLLADPTSLRAQILATGKIPKEVLDKIDDASLIKMVKDIMGSTTSDFATSNGNTSTTAP